MNKVTHAPDGTRRSPVIFVVILLLFLTAIAAGFLFVRSQKIQAATQAPDAHFVAPVLPSTAGIPALSEDVEKLEKRFDHLEEQLDAIDPRITSINDSLLRLIDSVAAMNSNITTLLERVPEQKTVAPRRTSTRSKPRAKKQAKPIALPSLVSVDTWGSHNNATIRNSDGSIRFIRTGDTVGVARVGAIDPVARSVTLVMPNGTKSSLVAPR